MKSQYQTIKETHNHLCKSWECALPDEVEMTSDEFSEYEKSLHKHELPAKFYKGMKIIVKQT